MARKYSKVERFFWRNPTVRRLSRDGRDMFMHLLTTPQQTMAPGLIPVSLVTLADDICWSVDAAKAALDELEAFEKAIYDPAVRVVFVLDAVHHNPPESMKVVAGWRNAFDDVPDCHARRIWHRRAFDYLKLQAAADPVWLNRFNTFTEIFGTPLPAKKHTPPDTLSDTKALPDPVPDPVPVPEGGFTRALFSNDKEKTKTVEYVELCCKLWPRWNQMQVEQSLLILLPAIKGARLNPEQVIRETRLAMPPEEGDYLRAHTWIARQIGIQRRALDRAETPGRRPVVEPEARTHEQQLADLTPEDRAKQEAFDLEAREKYGHLDGEQSAGKLADILAMAAEATKLPEDEGGDQ